MIVSNMQNEIFFLPELWWFVLARLPVYALLRFRFVCKSWCSLINSPEFIRAHLRLYKHNVEKTRVLVLEKVRPRRSGPSKFNLTIRDKHTFKVLEQCKDNFKSIKFLNSCNGVLCIWDSTLSLWNPSLGSHIFIPRCPLPIKHLSFILGYVTSSDDYRVLAYRDDGHGLLNMSSIAVYSLNDQVWRAKTIRVNNVPVSHVSKLVSRSWWHHACLGAVHWMVSDDPTSCFWEGATHVLSFVFDLEEFQSIELPNNIGSDMCKFVIVANESLAVFGISYESSCIWTMKKNGEEVTWSLCFSGSSNFGAYNFFQSHKSAKVSYDDKSNTMFLFTLQGKMMSYNVTSHKVCDIGRAGLRSNSLPRHITYVDTFVASLVLFRHPMVMK